MARSRRGHCPSCGAADVPGRTCAWCVREGCVECVPNSATNQEAGLHEIDMQMEKLRQAGGEGVRDIGNGPNKNTISAAFHTGFAACLDAVQKGLLPLAKRALRAHFSQSREIEEILGRALGMVMDTTEIGGGPSSVFVALDTPETLAQMAAERIAALEKEVEELRGGQTTQALAPQAAQPDPAEPGQARRARASRNPETGGAGPQVVDGTDLRYAKPPGPDFPF